MKNIKYIAEVLPDGHLSLPEKIKKRLGLKTRSRLQVQIEIEDPDNVDLSRFCGKWQDDKDCEEMIQAIYDSRKKNIRSEKANL